MNGARLPAPDPRIAGARIAGARPTGTGTTVVLGAAGTGKTQSLWAATTELVTEVGSQRVVGVAGDRRAARDWQAAVSRDLPGAAPAITTVTGLAQQILAGGAATTGHAAGATGVVAADDPDVEPLRVLTAPEQELVIREVLAGTVAAGPAGPGEVAWPPEWKAALPTRSFARQVRRAVARARRLGWEPDELLAEADALGDPGWAALARFLAEYLQNLDWQSAVDYGEVALRALRRCESQPPTAGLVLLVDDAHHLDPTQARLLQALTAAGRLIVAADPDQMVGSYRGADPEALRLLAADATVVTLDRVHRGGTAMRDARARLMGARWYAGLPTGPAAAYRQPAVVSDGDRIEALEFDDGPTQAAHLAQRLLDERRRGRAWRDMAVLVMSPALESADLVSAFGRARIPLHVPTADLALADHPAVATLLRAAACVSAPESSEVGEEGDARWESLLTSDMGGLAPRRLWEARRRLAAAGPVSSWAEQARDPVALADLEDDLSDVVAALRDLDRRVTAARRCDAAGGTPAEVLWELWHGPDGSWPQRLRNRALGEGRSAVAAGRDLDAMIEVFRLAERAPERWGGHRSFAVFTSELAHQEIPAEPDLSTAGSADRVTLMSLHRSLGREWPFVVVTGLQESRWQATDGGGLLDAGRLTSQALLPEAPRRAAGEMRRLFGVALSRASDSLVLAACGGADDPPPRFLSDAGLELVRVPGVPSVPPTPLELGLVARRLAAVDGDEGAVAALTLMHRTRDESGVLRFPVADAWRWDGASPWTVGVAPLRPPDRPLALSGSGLALLDRCQLRWLLQRELAGDAPPGPAVGFGLVVHAAAAAAAAGHGDASAELVDRQWIAGDYDADWYAEERRAAAILAVERVREWLPTRTGDITPEFPIDAVLPVRDAAGEEVDRVRLIGSADVLESHPEHVLVWDYKTQASPTPAADTEASVQLAVYQAAVAQMHARPAAGAGLVHTCVPAGTGEPLQPKVRHQGPLADRAEFLDDVLRHSVTALRSERFGAQPGPACRTCPFSSWCPAQQGRPS